MVVARKAVVTIGRTGGASHRCNRVSDKCSSGREPAMPETSSVSREDQARSGPGFNRRDFLKGSSAAVAATAIATEFQESVAQEAAKKKAVVGDKPTEI